MKELEKEEDKDDTPVSIEEIGASDDQNDRLEEEAPAFEEEDEEFEDEDEEPTDDDLEYAEEYGLDEFSEDAYERGEE